MPSIVFSDPGLRDLFTQMESVNEERLRHIAAKLSGLLIAVKERGRTGGNIRMPPVARWRAHTS